MDELTGKAKMTISTKIYILVTLVVMFFFLATVISYAQHKNWEWRRKCGGTLRSIGSSMLAYQSNSPFAMYGSFETLAASILETGENEILSHNGFFRMVHEDRPDSDLRVIYAFPTNTRVMGLQTFAMSSDNVTRVFNPDAGNDPDDFTTWDLLE